MDVLRQHKRAVLLTGGSVIANNTIGNIFVAYALSYTTCVLGMDKPHVLWMLVVARAVWLVAIGPFARLSDELGRRSVFLFVVGLMAWTSAVFFPVLNAAATVPMLAVLLLVRLGLACACGPQPGLFAELFPTEVRMSGASLGHQIGGVLGGGLVPIVATASTRQPAPHSGLRST